MSESVPFESDVTGLKDVTSTHLEHTRVETNAAAPHLLQIKC